MWIETESGALINTDHCLSIFTETTEDGQETIYFDIGRGFHAEYFTGPPEACEAYLDMLAAALRTERHKNLTPYEQRVFLNFPEENVDG